jgi:hypothetical protein
VPFGHSPLKFIDRPSLHLSFLCIRLGVAVSALRSLTRKSISKPSRTCLSGAPDIESPSMPFGSILHDLRLLTGPAFTCCSRAFDTESPSMSFYFITVRLLPTGLASICYSCAFDMKLPSVHFDHSRSKFADRLRLHLPSCAFDMESPSVPFGPAPPRQSLPTDPACTLLSCAFDMESFSVPFDH